VRTFLLSLILAPIAFFLTSSTVWLYVAGLQDHPYYVSHPWRWATAWLNYAMNPAGLSDMAKLVLIVAGIVGAVVALLTVAVITRLALLRARAGLHGKASWQTLWGAYRSGIGFYVRPPGDGILLGKRYGLYASLRGEGHVSLTAPNGSGKGRGFVVPNTMNWDGPLFVFSVKRDVAEAAAAERLAKGDKVYLFDVTAPDYQTHRFSGLSELSDIYDDAQRMMFTLIPEVKTSNPFWNDCARMVATAITVMLAETPNVIPSIGGVLRTINRADYEQHLRQMIDAANFENRSFPANAVHIVLDWLDNSESTGGPAKASVKQTIVTSLSLWNVPRIDAVTRTSDFKLSEIRSQRTTVFVVAQAGDIRRLRPVFNLLFTQMFYMNAREEWRPGKLHRDVRTLCIFDERWALGSMPVVDDAISFIRSYGIRIATVLQTKDQMKRALGEEGARNLFNNCYVEMIFGGCDMETAKEVCERAGKTTVENISESRPKFFAAFSNRTENKAVIGRDLMLPQEVAMLPQSTVVVLIKGQPPLKLNKIQWDKDAHFAPMAGPMPEFPKLHVEVERYGQPAPSSPSISHATQNQNVVVSHVGVHMLGN
jgi:type IV secretion system protein VirD4